MNQDWLGPESVRSSAICQESFAMEGCLLDINDLLWQARAMRADGEWDEIPRVLSDLAESIAELSARLGSLRDAVGHDRAISQILSACPDA